MCWWDKQLTLFSLRGRTMYHKHIQYFFLGAIYVFIFCFFYENYWIVMFSDIQLFDFSYHFYLSQKSKKNTFFLLIFCQTPEEGYNVPRRFIYLYLINIIKNVHFFLLHSESLRYCSHGNLDLIHQRSRKYSFFSQLTGISVHQ